MTDDDIYRMICELIADQTNEPWDQETRNAALQWLVKAGAASSVLQDLVGTD